MIDTPGPDHEGIVPPGPRAAPKLAARTARLGSSAVRDILRLAAEPGVISFCGGLPAPELLPRLGDGAIAASAGQYGATEGEPTLRAWVADHLTRLGRPCSPAQVLITSGAQQGLDLTAKLLIDAGTGLVCESPTYLAALQAFRLFGANLRPVDVDRNGLDLAGLRGALSSPGTTGAYLVPTFQNPGAHCYPPENRRGVAETLDASAAVLIEDGAYADLAFEPVDATPVSGHLRRAPWIYLGSFSKVLLPGLRLGYLVADERLMPYLVRLKQAADLHSSRVGQQLLLDWLERHDYAAQVDAARALYRQRRDHMADALKRHLGGAAAWAMPAGGLFFWARLDRGVDTGARLTDALTAGVAYTPGAPFFAEAEPPRHWLRLNFSNPTPADIDAGLARLARVLDTTRSRRNDADTLLPG